ncbi:MAG TPA: CDP-alcohol phosphatidyltransferase family protein [Gammaproteobacteria bacterium]|jgi:CDP-diacylglycerol--glycerol-3-phosphate 3-phosphatidyltransferase|nr:CDP-alcohol phosphatidyltransferase family protein [Gammaproteobacteria bacterium]
MANLVTLSRLLLLIVVVALSYVPPTPWQLANFFLIILIFVTDGLDGYVARKRNETSLFGALFDIAGDRIVELTLWIVAADTDLVRAWVPLVFIWRGVIVDTIRSSNAVAQGMAPFALMRSRFGKFIVASRFVRVLYAVVKAAAFAGLALQRPLPRYLPELWAYVEWPLTTLTYFFVDFAVVLCIARGVPVVAEFVYSQKNDILRRPGRKQ